MTFPKSYEDHLMVRYWESVCEQRGTMWLEVGLGKGPGNWSGTSERRLDGLWVPDAADRGPVTWERHDDHLPVDLDVEWVQVIEAKRHINYDVIGQTLAGVDMLVRSYPSRAVIDRCVVVSGEPDPVLDQVCSRWGIAVYRYQLG